MNRDPQSGMSGTGTKSKRTLFHRIRWIIALVALVPILVTLFLIERQIGRARREVESTDRALAETDASIENLTLRAGQFETIIGPVKNDRAEEHLEMIYSLYQTVEEIADNPSDFVLHSTSDVADLADARLAFSVPDGEHRLEISFTRTEVTGGEEERVLEEETWNVDLAGRGGYMVLIDHPKPEDAADDKPRQMTLYVSSNVHSFATLEKPMLEPFRRPFATDRYSLPSGVSFPNQIDRSDLIAQRVADLSTKTTSRKGILNRFSWSTRNTDGQEFRIKCEMRLHSDSPLVIRISDSIFITPHQYKLGEYLGNGSFLVEEVNEEDVP